MHSPKIKFKYTTIKQALVSLSKIAIISSSGETYRVCPKARVSKATVAHNVQQGSQEKFIYGDTIYIALAKAHSRATQNILDNALM